LSGAPVAEAGPAAAREPARRLFFALWPDATQRAQFTHALRKAVSSCDGRPVPAANLHVTLAFLGSVPERRLAELTRIAQQVARGCTTSGPLRLRFERTAHWARPQILCALADEEPPAAAGALAAALRNETAACGFSPDLKPFHAHVTAARKVVHPPGAHAPPQFEWRFDGFALLESRTRAAGPVYSVFESYLLAKG
jgi:RNA 2',3'-cyclic 3'-phosphodiesterase